MKLLLISSILLSTTAFGARCLPTYTATTRCDVQVTGTTVAECHGSGRTNPADYRGNYPGNYPRPFPGTYIPDTYTRPWNRVEMGTEASACEVNLEDCKYFAARQLDKYREVTNCGDISVGKSVEYRFTSYNNDGTVAEEINGRMRK